MEDSYGNFIIQKLLYQVDNQQKTILLDEIRRLIPMLQKKNVQRKWSSIVDEHSYSQTSSNLEKESDSKEYDNSISISYSQQHFASGLTAKEKKSNFKKGNKTKQKLSFKDSKESVSNAPQVEMQSQNFNINNISSSSGQVQHSMLSNLGMFNSVSYHPYPYGQPPTYNNFNQRSQAPVFSQGAYPSYYHYTPQAYGLMPNSFCYDNSMSSNIYYQNDTSSTPQQQSNDYSQHQYNNQHFQKDRMPKGKK